MSDVKCRECGGELKIVGTGGYGDTIRVLCYQDDRCGEEYEVEPDGLGEGGMELYDAIQIEEGNPLWS